MTHFSTHYVAFRVVGGRRTAVISRDCLTQADMGLSCCKTSVSCPQCRERCGEDCLCACHTHEPCVDRCCNLCFQFCLDGCCVMCSDDCRYTVCFMCTRMAHSCAAVMKTEQPTSTQTWGGRKNNKHNMFLCVKEFGKSFCKETYWKLTAAGEKHYKCSFI